MVAAARGSLLPWATPMSTPDSASSDMDPALGLAGALPPPAARVVARPDPCRAGRAADRRVTVVHQRVDQHVVVGDELVDLLAGPPDDRVDLDHLPPVIPLHHAHVPA